MLKIFGISVCGAVLVLVLKEQKSALGAVLTITLSLLLFFFAMPYVESVIQTLQSLFGAAHEMRAYFHILLKIIGISVVGQIGADVCKDAGLISVANGIALFGRALSLVLCLPAVEALVTMLGGMLPG